ncbi:MAG: ABC transporter permease [Lachnospiraceae bacterium]|nr:ABC transporter permease [Lachnospiraceae bacterium]
MLTFSDYKKKITDNWFLLSELVKKGVRLKYRRSYLGILWSLIEPILTTIVLVIVFGTMMRKRPPDFSLYIVCGRIVYSFYSSTTKSACMSLWKNRSMIKKVYLPKYLYPIAECVYQFMIFGISLSVVALVMLYCRRAPTHFIWQVIPALMILFLLTVGSGLILSPLHVFFRDIEYLWNVVLMLIQYMCAIFYYPKKLMNSQWGFILKLNPMFCIIDAFRGGIMGYLADPWDLMYSGCFAVVLFLLGVFVFRRCQEELVFYL